MTWILHYVQNDDMKLMNNLKPNLFKEQIIKSIREFFYSRSFHEVITPVFNPALPLEPNLYAFVTVWKTNKGDQKLYLTTSPESQLKKMIARGIGNCFSIGKSFRNLEDSGPLHNPEFLMLEWYRENADYRQIMTDCEELILYISDSLSSQSLSHYHTTVYGSYPRISLVDLFQEYARVDLEKIINDENMRLEAIRKGYSLGKRDQNQKLSFATKLSFKKGEESNRQTRNDNFTWEQLFNQIYLNEIEPKLPPKAPFFLTDFPSRISPLCKPRQDKPYLAERFEVYMKGMELGNGNTENTDAKAVLKAFREEEMKRKAKSEVCPPIDMEFISSLEKMKDKSYAGIGLGVDRLVMILGGIEDINLLE